ncbi:polysaccharide deacetylase family protein [Bradyrhizobium manausense]|uniref:polysaccharide deacetylase family protein n=1 Tax=Bradyrhizobium TaxID=374 RepID=UPI001BAB4964|nr:MULTISPECIES: polysaccharide deacetylase family protein [Bradyrhizobium]MBR0830158.1 polysaccharide deacetylase family protein [Bradyrhizobium manausense]UVO30875.1 polysaccharide deacetylase family protein [Bradyrhizobium arachidis]
MRREVTILVYHHIADHEDPLTSKLGVVTRPDVFEKHIQYFARHFDIVSGSDLVSGTLPRRPLLITFDDAYRSVLDTASTILKTANAPSLFFVNPATMLGSSLPVDNILSLAAEVLGKQQLMALLNINETGLTSVPGLIANVVSKWTQAQIAEAKQQLCAAMGTNELELRRTSKLFLGITDIKRFASLGIEVGNHSMSHTFFRSLSSTELETEIEQSRELLETFSGQRVQCLSIPYGNALDATEGALRAARRSHKAIFLVHAKSNRFKPATDIFYRISLRNTAPEEIPFKLRIMPVMRCVRDWLW